MLDQNQAKISLGSYGSGFKVNKSLVTNGVAVLVSVLGYFSPVYPDILKNIGFYALSGAITNWLAIYMLFEKVPFLYGSGVIPNRFEEFKLGIRSLIMNQFFTSENVKRFFSEQEDSYHHDISLQPVLNGLDYDLLYEKLISAVKSSPLGGMLALVGGDQALEPVKEPFIQKMRETLLEFTENPEFQKTLRNLVSQYFDSDSIVEKVEDIVQKRLDELTPQMVKDIIQEMIRTHLGWLVVWGGVFGGILGFFAYFI
ncbi:MAG: DUF445 domain-containing protein [Oligoflexales bacterium]